MKAFPFLLALAFLAALPPFVSAETKAPQPEGRRRMLVPSPDAVIPMAAPAKSDSIVKVNVTYQAYNPHLPWQKQSPGAALHVTGRWAAGSPGHLQVV